MGVKRFEVDSSEGLIESYRVIVDKKTGVNYLYIGNGTSAGMTVLLDSQYQLSYFEIEAITHFKEL